MSKGLLPVPFMDFVPESMREEISKGSSEDGQVFCNYMDTLISELQELVKTIGYIQTPERCPEQFLEELGYLLSAGILVADTSTEKRLKIANAISSRNKKGSFQNFIKGVIDNLTGFSSELYPGNLLTDELGNFLVDENGDYLSDKENGYIMIDIGDAGASAPSVIAEVEAVLRLYVTLAYFYVDVGYISAGSFVRYFVI